MKSESLKKYLLNKYAIKKLDELDFELIEELSLNKIVNNNEQDYDFSDFELFNNLKYVSFQNFKINNYETNELGRCKKLSAIQFSNCKFNCKSRLKGNVKVISFNNCKGFKFKYLALLKNLEIVRISNFKIINLKNIFYYIKNIEKIYFENTRILNFKDLDKLKNLNLVEVVNCKWNKNTQKNFSNAVQIEE